MDPPSPNTTNTLISDLGDDCLLGVFKHLDLSDLCTVADVCSRFRLNARNHFASALFNGDCLRITIENGDHDRILVGPRGNSSDHTHIVNFTDFSLVQRFLHVSKVIRNFGDVFKCAFIYAAAAHVKFDNQSKYEKSIFDLIGL